jgi:hypothetical protein
VERAEKPAGTTVAARRDDLTDLHEGTRRGNRFLAAVRLDAQGSQFRAVLRRCL